MLEYWKVKWSCMLSCDVDGFQGELMMAFPKKDWEISQARKTVKAPLRSTSRFLAPSYFAVACSTHVFFWWKGKVIKRAKVACVRWGDEVPEINVGPVEAEPTNKTLPKWHESLDEQLGKMLINKWCVLLRHDAAWCVSGREREKSQETFFYTSIIKRVIDWSSLAKNDASWCIIFSPKSQDAAQTLSDLSSPNQFPIHQETRTNKSKTH